MMLRILKILFVLLAVHSLAACAHVSLLSMYKLRNFDPMTTDAQQLRIAVRIPEDMGIPSDGVRIIFEATHSKPSPWKEEFFLAQIASQKSLEKLDQPGKQVHAYRIAPTDIDRFDQTREKVKVEMAAGRPGSMEVIADACYTTAEFPNRLPVSTFVNASETDGYVGLLLNVNMLDNRAQRAPEKCAE